MRQGRLLAALARVRQAGKPYVLAYHHTHEHACVGVDNTGAVRELVLRLAGRGLAGGGRTAGRGRGACLPVALLDDDDAAREYEEAGADLCVGKGPGIKPELAMKLAPCFHKRFPAGRGA